MKFLTVSLKTAFFFFPHLACSRRDKCINRRLKKTPNKVGAEEDAAPNPAEGQQRCATHTQCPGVLGGGCPGQVTARGWPSCVLRSLNFASSPKSCQYHQVVYRGGAGGAALLPGRCLRSRDAVRVSVGTLCSLQNGGLRGRLPHQKPVACIKNNAQTC